VVNGPTNDADTRHAMVCSGHAEQATRQTNRSQIARFATNADRHPNAAALTGLSTAHSSGVMSAEHDDGSLTQR
jgi:hypothetical protein